MKRNSSPKAPRPSTRKLAGGAATAKPIAARGKPEVPFEVTLRRELGFPLVMFFGLGNIVGAGIYVLAGAVAGQAGMLAPLSFLVASAVAALTAFSYAELSSRYPTAAGNAIYVYRGLHSRRLATVVGLVLVFSGIVSAAAIAHGFAGYVRELVDLPAAALTGGIILLLGAVSALRVRFSLGVVAGMTVLELAGLLLIIGAGLASGATRWERWPELFQIGDPLVVLPGVLGGAFLAFYAFIGFEDMVNLAEETKDPRRTMPRAVLTALGVATALYLAVVSIAVLAVDPAVLASSEAPMGLVFTELGGPAIVISLIGILAVIGGILVQVIMGSRLLYGMADRRWLPAALGRLNRVTRTPVRTTALVTAAMFAFALALPLISLAELTSYAILIVFTLVNAALLHLKLSHSPARQARVSYPIWIPALGLLANVALIVANLAR